MTAKIKNTRRDALSPGCRVAVADARGYLLADSVSDMPFTFATSSDGTGTFHRRRVNESADPAIAAAAQYLSPRPAHTPTVKEQLHALTATEKELHELALFFRICPTFSTSFQGYHTDTEAPYAVDLLPSERALRGATVQDCRLKLRVRGAYIPVEVSAAPLYQSGRVVHGVLVFQDITEASGSSG